MARSFVSSSKGTHDTHKQAPKIVFEEFFLVVLFHA